MTPPVRTDPSDHTIETVGPELELVTARRAVERARQRVDALSAEVGEQPDPQASLTALLDADVEHANAISEELRDARRRARRPFGRSAAKRVVSLELAERLALDRIGLAESDASPAVTHDVVIDLAQLDRARRELGQAEAHLEQLLEPQVGAALPRRQRPWRPVILA